MNLRKWYRLAVIALAISLSAAKAEAGPLIDGTFSIAGFFNPVNAQTGANTSLNAATGIDFTNLLWGNPNGTGQFLVTTAGGDFDGLLGQVGAIHDFAFSGNGSASIPKPPIAPFESLLLGGLTFDLLNIVVNEQNSAIVHLSGEGVFKWASAGFDDTYGLFDLYATAGGFEAGFNIATGTSPNPVPEPASLLLMGSGIAAAYGSARRRRRNAAAA